MAYNPLTDFLALLRLASDGAHSERVPGLDYVVAALARIGQFRLSVGQTAPTSNQASTVWLKPAQPSWTAEGVVYLWNSSTAAYELATPALWIAQLAAGSYSFQSVNAASGAVLAGTTLLAVQRAAPSATALVLPNLAAQWLAGKRLQIVDFSTAVTNHAITLTTPDGATIMQNASWQLLSTADQLAGVALQPSPNLSAWVIAP